MGRILASALTTTVARKPSKFRIDRDDTRRRLFIDFPPVIDMMLYYMPVIFHCK
jgi:hypothetical protein